MATETFCLCAFCATPHTYTQVETRDNHPLPDSPPSISSHKEGQPRGRTREKKKKQKGEKQHKLAEPLSLSSAIVFQSYWLQCFHRQHCLPYIKLSHTHTSLLFCLSHFVVVVSLFFLFLFLILFGRSHQLTNRPPLID